MGPWFRHSFWNVLEHGLTRVSDSATSFVLLWVLSAEAFSKLALAQAIVAPLLFLFIAPETVIYRDFGLWKERGASEIASRLHAFRKFAWGKAQFAVVLSGIIALVGGDREARFWALLWAFAVVLAPQISGPDREFLRVDLKLPELNAISLYQKVSLLAGTILASVIFPGRLGILAAVAVASALSTAILARYVAIRSLRRSGASEAALLGREGASVTKVISESLVGFSFWQHINGVVLGWIQTMDLFFLGVLRLPARGLGLYAVALKVGNVAIALPTALSNTFSIWLGRRTPAHGHYPEMRGLVWVSLALATLIVAQAIVIYLLSPWIFRFFSHGRWSLGERAQMRFWLGWILIGSSVLATGWPLLAWLVARTPVGRLAALFYLPWGVLTAGVYVVAILTHGFAGAAFANVLVAGVYAVLLLPQVRSLRGGRSLS